MNMKKFGLIALVCALALVLSGCGGSSAPAPAPAATPVPFPAAQPVPDATKSPNSGHLSGARKTEEVSSYRQITQDEAKAIMAESSNYVLLDVRTQEEFDEGHIPGAVCVPNETIGAAEIPELPDRNQTILVYCRSGNRSKQAALKLTAMGYLNVLEFGGIQDWTGEIEK